jgi:putative ABC transport system permease protein
MTDVRRALRRLAATPGFTIAAVFTLALGIGANTLTFSAIHGLLVRPLPFTEAERIAWVFTRDTSLGISGEAVSAEESNAVASAAAFESIANIGARSLIRADGDRRFEWKGLWVTANLASLLDVTPALGRTFSAEDMPRGPAPAMMLGYERWQRDFAGDPTILGRVLRFSDDKAGTVVGVLPRGLEFPFGRTPGASTGAGFTAGVQDFWLVGQDRADEYPGGMTIARLRPGAPARIAAAAADAAAAAVRRASPGRAGRSFSVVPLRDHALGFLGPGLPLVQGFAALVLLIACANLANLVLARAATARAEFALRTALGARTFDLLRILLAESLLLSVAGAGCGVFVAWAGQRAFAQLAAGQVALADRVRLDGTVLLFTLVLCVVTTVIFGLLPLIVRSSAPAASMLDRGGRSQTAGRRHGTILKALVVSQVAVALVLLTAGALVMQSLMRLLSVDAGYERGRVLTADLLLYERGSEVQPFFLRLHERLRGLPGVEAVGLIQSTPLTGKWTFREPIVVAGRPRDGRSDVAVPGSMVAFDYFKAMGIPIIEGRDFTRAEFLQQRPLSMIINDVAARLFFPGETAVGRRLHMFGRDREIVGVVKATRDVRLDTPPEPQWYQPMFFGSSQLVVRTAGDPAAFAATLQRELLASDPRLIVKQVAPLDEIVAASVFERRLATQFLSIFAAIALALAVVGLYGMLNFSTIQRRREFGVRAALGAQRRDLVAMVLAQGLGMTAIGIAIGVVGSVPLSAAFRHVLFEVSALDPLTMVMAGIVLAASAAAACFIPAWRAASTDPSIALRAE